MQFNYLHNALNGRHVVRLMEKIDVLVSRANCSEKSRAFVPQPAPSSRLTLHQQNTPPPDLNATPLVCLSFSFSLPYSTGTL